MDTLEPACFEVELNQSLLKLFKVEANPPWSRSVPASIAVGTWIEFISLSMNIRIRFFIHASFYGGVSITCGHAIDIKSASAT